jgi:hypothetical protein
MKDYTKLTLSDFAIKVEGNRKEIEAFYQKYMSRDICIFDEAKYASIDDKGSFHCTVSKPDLPETVLTLPEALTWEVVNTCEFTCVAEVSNDGIEWNLTYNVKGYLSTLEKPIVCLDCGGNTYTTSYARIPQPQDTAESLLREVAHYIHDYKDISDRIEKFLNDQSK